MNKISYRPIMNDDYPAMLTLLKDAWDFSIFFDAPDAQDAMYEDYLYRCLEDVTYAEAAVLNGKMVGFMTAVAEGEPRVLDQEYLSARLEVTHAKMEEVIRRDKRKRLSMIRQSGRFYKKAVCELPQPMSGHIELFIVGSGYQGHGIGKELLDRFETYFKRHMDGGYYVQTDTMCNYHFYDLLGFEMNNQKRLPLGDGEFIDLFLYSKKELLLCQQF